MRAAVAMGMAAEVAGAAAAFAVSEAAAAAGAAYDKVTSTVFQQHASARPSEKPPTAEPGLQQFGSSLLNYFWRAEKSSAARASFSPAGVSPAGPAASSVGTGLPSASSSSSDASWLASASPASALHDAASRTASGGSQGGGEQREGSSVVARFSGTPNQEAKTSTEYTGFEETGYPSTSSEREMEAASHKRAGEASACVRQKNYEEGMRARASESGDQKRRYEERDSERLSSPVCQADCSLGSSRCEAQASLQRQTQGDIAQDERVGGDGDMETAVGVRQYARKRKAQREAEAPWLPPVHPQQAREVSQVIAAAASLFELLAILPTACAENEATADFLSRGARASRASSLPSSSCVSGGVSASPRPSPHLSLSSLSSSSSPSISYSAPSSLTPVDGRESSMRRQADEAKHFLLRYPSVGLPWSVCGASAADSASALSSSSGSRASSPGPAFATWLGSPLDGAPLAGRCAVTDSSSPSPVSAAAAVAAWLHDLGTPVLRVAQASLSPSACVSCSSRAVAASCSAAAASPFSLAGAFGEDEALLFCACFFSPEAAASCLAENAEDFRAELQTEGRLLERQRCLQSATGQGEARAGRASSDAEKGGKDALDASLGVILEAVDRVWSCANGRGWIRVCLLIASWWRTPWSSVDRGVRGRRFSTVATSLVFSQVFGSPARSPACLAPCAPASASSAPLAASPPRSLALQAAARPPRFEAVLGAAARPELRHLQLAEAVKTLVCARQRAPRSCEGSDGRGDSEGDGDAYEDGDDECAPFWEAVEPLAEASAKPTVDVEAEDSGGSQSKPGGRERAEESGVSRGNSARDAASARARTLPEGAGRGAAARPARGVELTLESEMEVLAAACVAAFPEVLPWNVFAWLLSGAVALQRQVERDVERALRWRGVPRGRPASGAARRESEFLLRASDGVWICVSLDFAFARPPTIASPRGRGVSRDGGAAPGDQPMPPAAGEDASSYASARRRRVPKRPAFTATTAQPCPSVWREEADSSLRAVVFVPLAALQFFRRYLSFLRCSAGLAALGWPGLRSLLALQARLHSLILVSHAARRVALPSHQALPAAASCAAADEPEEVEATPARAWGLAAVAAESPPAAEALSACVPPSSVCAPLDVPSPTVAAGLDGEASGSVGAFVDRLVQDTALASLAERRDAAEVCRAAAAEPRCLLLALLRAALQVGSAAHVCRLLTAVLPNLLSSLRAQAGGEATPPEGTQAALLSAEKSQFNIPPSSLLHEAPTKRRGDRESESKREEEEENILVSNGCQMRREGAAEMEALLLRCAAFLAEALAQTNSAWAMQKRGNGDISRGGKRLLHHENVARRVDKRARDTAQTVRGIREGGSAQIEEEEGDVMHSDSKQGEDASVPRPEKGFTGPSRVAAKKLSLEEVTECFALLLACLRLLDARRPASGEAPAVEANGEETANKDACEADGAGAEDAGESGRGSREKGDSLRGTEWQTSRNEDLVFFFLASAACNPSLCAYAALNRVSAKGLQPAKATRDVAEAESESEPRLLSPKPAGSRVESEVAPRETAEQETSTRRPAEPKAVGARYAPLFSDDEGDTPERQVCEARPRPSAARRVATGAREEGEQRESAAGRPNAGRRLTRPSPSSVSPSSSPASSSSPALSSALCLADSAADSLSPSLFSPPASAAARAAPVASPGRLRRLFADDDEEELEEEEGAEASIPAERRGETASAGQSSPSLLSEPRDALGAADAAGAGDAEAASEGVPQSFLEVFLASPSADPLRSLLEEALASSVQRKREGARQDFSTDDTDADEAAQDTGRSRRKALEKTEEKENAESSETSEGKGGERCGEDEEKAEERGRGQDGDLLGPLPGAGGTRGNVDGVGDEGGRQKKECVQGSSDVVSPWPLGPPSPSRHAVMATLLALLEERRFSADLATHPPTLRGSSTSSLRGARPAPATRPRAKQRQGDSHAGHEDPLARERDSPRTTCSTSAAARLWQVVAVPVCIHAVFVARARALLAAAARRRKDAMEVTASTESEAVAASERPQLKAACERDDSLVGLVACLRACAEAPPASSAASDAWSVAQTTLETGPSEAARLTPLHCRASALSSLVCAVLSADSRARAGVTPSNSWAADAWRYLSGLALVARGAEPQWLLPPSASLSLAPFASASAAFSASDDPRAPTCVERDTPHTLYAAASARLRPAHGGEERAEEGDGQVAGADFEDWGPAASRGREADGDSGWRGVRTPGAEVGGFAAEAADSTRRRPAWRPAVFDAPSSFGATSFAFTWGAGLRVCPPRGRASGSGELVRAPEHTGLLPKGWRSAEAEGQSFAFAASSCTRAGGSDLSPDARGLDGSSEGRPFHGFAAAAGPEQSSARRDGATLERSAVAALAALEVTMQKKWKRSLAARASSDKEGREATREIRDGGHADSRNEAEAAETRQDEASASRQARGRRGAAEERTPRAVADGSLHPESCNAAGDEAEDDGKTPTRSGLERMTLCSSPSSFVCKETRQPPIRSPFSPSLFPSSGSSPSSVGTSSAKSSPSSQLASPSSPSPQSEEARGRPLASSPASTSSL
ncbi:hypothetical protein BESB_021690 [Besnoitia besnoiti]|uniref:Uncharacterized protein n=1 Tax=Besnoitia besnoiti TaxID=94643 RepID=A0A2A9M100_BESBE|nr:hypothetical protein BESB_021690 [Besnoitia besnoiti]PFH32228.1 hypothetical protein BESB_021690 [Besnoitia besnoiti]